MLKGEIWWAELPTARGSEPAKTRPVLIVQCDMMNRSSLHTVICAAITSNLALEHAPGNFRLEKSVSGLEKTSVINFSQIVTIDKAFLRECVRTLPKLVAQRIDQSLKTVFGILN
ncbi:MAG: type II toxin-antitoxin system PemK/MazF family toxin [Treponema sp.]|jgi:mRNA interferase MazF|nr:type II toxin-antitoxin system PemK/MazF family toxin [Treponema sp.]